MKHVLFVLLLCFFSSMLFGVTANPQPFFVQQQDGQMIRVVQRGNEWHNWLETMDGYAIEKTMDGWWVYSGTKGVKQGLLRVGIDDPAGRVEKQPDTILRPVPEGAAFPLGLPFKNVPAVRSVLVILVEFSDRSSLGTTPGQWADRIFREPGNSVADYYLELSKGQASLAPAPETHGTANDGIVGWVKLDYPHPGTGTNTGEANRRITRDAVLAADQYVDFQSFDNNKDGYISSAELGIIVVAAGYETSYSHYGPGVWSHQWSLKGKTVPVCDGVKIGAWMGAEDTRTGGYIQFGEWHQSHAGDGHMATVGKMAHEWGHFAFDLPDLDNINGSLDGESRSRLMGTGAWGKANAGAYPGRNPVHMIPWSKQFCDFVGVEPEIVVDVQGTDDLPLSTLLSGPCWTGSHAPPNHVHSGSLKCWSYGVLKGFTTKYPSKFSSCDPTQGTSINTIPSTYYTTYTYSAGSVQAGDLIGTAGGLSHIAHVTTVYYPISEYTIIISDANRFGSGVVRTWDTLAEMLDDRNESASKIYRPKDLTFPPTNTPTLNSPASGSYIATSHTLAWSGSGFDNYTLLVDTNSSFSSPDSYTQTGTSKTLTFSPGTANYWKVRGNNSCGSGPYTSYRWVGIATVANQCMYVGTHGPYYEFGNQYYKIKVTFTTGNLHDVSYVKIYKKFGSGSWQYVTTKYSLPYSYNGPEITMVNGIPVKSGPRVYYQGRFYEASGSRYVSGEVSAYYHLEF
jgi:M6 family metalloprotease-like protein